VSHLVRKKSWNIQITFDMLLKEKEVKVVAILEHLLQWRYKALALNKPPICSAGYNYMRSSILEH
jgi:hypothetical protein